MGANERKSRKPSAANFNSPPERLVFFIDRSLGRKVISMALRDAGEEVLVHDEHFPQGAKDEIWLTEAGKKGWIILTKDKNIRYHGNEIQALLAANARAFILSSTKDLTGEEMGRIFLKALPAIKRHCNKKSPPFIALVDKGGNVRSAPIRTTLRQPPGAPES